MVYSHEMGATSGAWMDEGGLGGGSRRNGRSKAWQGLVKPENTGDIAQKNGLSHLFTIFCNAFVKQSCFLIRSTFTSNAGGGEISCYPYAYMRAA